MNGLLVAPSSAEFDVLVNQTYKLELYSSTNLDSLYHTCPIDAMIEDNVIHFSLNEYADSSQMNCQLFVYNSQRSELRGLIKLELDIQKNVTRSYTYEFIHYVTFTGQKKAEILYTNTGNIVLYPTFISANESINHIVLPFEKKEFWVNLSDSYIISCEQECDVLLPTEYVELSRPKISLRATKVGKGVQVTLEGVSFPTNLILHTEKKDVHKTVVEDGRYFFTEDAISVSVVYESTVLAFVEIESEEKSTVFSIKFLVFVSIICILFVGLFFLQQRKK